MTTPAERKAAERRRYKEQGRKALTVYLYPETIERTREFAEYVTKWAAKKRDKQ